MKHPHSKTFGFLTLTLAMVPPAFATSDSWKANAAGNWNNTASWTGGNIPGSTVALDSTDIATFGFTLATSGKTVSVDANRNIGGITFSNTSAFGYNDTTGGSNFTGDQASGTNARFVTMTLIPEPSAFLLTSLSAIALLRRRRH